MLNWFPSTQLIHQLTIIPLHLLFFQSMYFWQRTAQKSIKRPNSPRLISIINLGGAAHARSDAVMKYCNWLSLGHFFLWLLYRALVHIQTAFPRNPGENKSTSSWDGWVSNRTVTKLFLQLHCWSCWTVALERGWKWRTGQQKTKTKAALSLDGIAAWALEFSISPPFFIPPSVPEWHFTTKDSTQCIRWLNTSDA